MAASTAKDRFTAIWKHLIPAHLSIQEFSAKMEAQVDSLLALPSAQKNLLKYDLIIPNNKLDSYFKALGFPEPQPVVLGKIECEVEPSHAIRATALTTVITRAQNIARRDADAMKKISTAQEFAGASMFSVDVVTKIDTGSADGCDACIGIFKCPPHLSRTQFHEFVDKASNDFVALPTMQKNAVKQIMWIQNDAIKKDVQAMGVPAAETVALFMVQAVWTDDGLRQHFARVDKAATDEYSNRFSVLKKLCNPACYEEGSSPSVKRQIFVSVPTARQEFEYRTKLHILENNLEFRSSNYLILHAKRQEPGDGREVQVFLRGVDFENRYAVFAGGGGHNMSEREKYNFGIGLWGL
ncbi:hypothetical protein DFH09DRAFT_1088491 [Mycena vulgaris]|nr:hypothetical protein DFH09DRAFT_1088491 [Mycena vulgaris]